MRIIKDIKLIIDKDEVFRYQGYNGRKKINAKKNIVQITEKEIEYSHELFKPEGIYAPFKIKKITFPEDKIDLENGLSLTFNPSATNFLKGAEYLILGVITIGNALEGRISEYFTKNEYVRAFVLDTIGTVAVRCLSKYIRAIICQEAKEKNLQTTKKFTPGTTEWDIDQQKNIFNMIPTHKIGVKLNESFMMTPKKSLSWAIGLGKEAVKSSMDGHSCQICQAVNCQFRKK